MSFHPWSSCPHVLMSSVVERWVGRLVVVDGWMDGLIARRVVWTYVLQGTRGSRSCCTGREKCGIRVWMPAYGLSAQ